MFQFKKNINTDYLRLSQITYGGELFLGLKNYHLKEVEYPDSKIKKVYDTLLAQKGNNDFFSYKNEESGFTAVIFEHKITGKIIIGFRGTERPGLGENISDFASLGRDMQTDMSLIMSEFNEQYGDAYKFYNSVKSENPKSKIVIIGHSLGGALAQLTGAKIFSKTGEKPEVYTYNAPGCRHLLEVFGCKLNEKYSFIKNYTVMNDWCGMFGENIGETYLIPPIPLREVNTNSSAEVLANILLVPHEGIFEYSGIIFDKPKCFNQAEGLSLWYFDKNNPLKELDSFSNFTESFFPQFNIPDSFSETIKQAATDFLNAQDPKIQELATQIKESTDSFLNEQKAKFMESFNNNYFGMLSTFLDKTTSELTQESLNSALSYLRKSGILKFYSDYFE